MEILALPVRDSKEDRNDKCGDQFEIVGIKTCGEDKLNNDVVDDRAERNAQQLEREIVENAAEHDLADDDRRQADNDRAAAGVDVCEALILAIQRARERDQTVRDHQTEHLVEIDVDALCAAHVGVRAGRADGAAELSAEEPVQQRDNHHGKHRNDKDRVLRNDFLDISQRNEQRVVIRIDRDVRLAAHDAQVDGEQRELRQDTGENGRNTHKGMQDAGDETREHTGEERAQQRDPEIDAVRHQHEADCAARCHGAVNGQIGKIEHLEGDVHADCHEAPDETLCHRARKRGEQVREEFHFNSPKIKFLPSFYSCI